MIIELRSLLPVSEEEETPRDPGKNRPEARHEGMPPADVEIRSAASPSAPENESFSAYLPGSPLLPEHSVSPASEGAGPSGDDRIPELLERLLDAAERGAASSEQIAELIERQSPASSSPVYA